jgi:hypothetical protein
MGLREKASLSRLQRGAAAPLTNKKPADPLLDDGCKSGIDLIIRASREHANRLTNLGSGGLDLGQLETILRTRRIHKHCHDSGRGDHLVQQLLALSSQLNGQQVYSGQVGIWVAEVGHESENTKPGRPPLPNRPRHLNPEADI